MLEVIAPTQSPTEIPPRRDVTVALSQGLARGAATETHVATVQVDVARPVTLTSVITAGQASAPSAREDSEWVAAHFSPHRAHTAESAASVAMVMASAGAAHRALELLAEWKERSTTHYWVSHAYAKAYAALGRREEAERTVRDFLSRHPEDWRAWHDLGRLLLENDQPAAACDALAHAVEQHSAGSNAWSDYGASLIALRRATHAVRALRRALQLDRQNALALNNLAVCYVQLGLPEKAHAYFREALAVSSRFTVARNNLSEVLMAKGQYEAALDLLENDSDSIALEHKAWCNIKLGRRERARKLLTVAVEQSEHADASLVNNLATVYLSLGDPTRAEALFAHALRLDPQSPGVATNAARLALERGGSRVALSILEPWRRQLDSAPMAVLEVLGDTCLRLEDFESAVAALSLGTVKFPDHEPFWANLGFIYATRIGDGERAAALLRSGLEHLPRSLWIRNNLAYTYLKYGQLEGARAALAPTEAQLAHPEATPVFVCLLATWGLLLIREGHFGQGLELYRRAQTLAPRGRLKERVKQKIAIEEAVHAIGGRRPEDARRLLQRAIGLDADPEFTYEARQLLACTNIN